MATEEQIAYDGNKEVNNSGAAYCYSRAGQRLTISNRYVSTLSFVIHKLLGSPTGNVNFVIRKVSDDSIVAQKSYGDASTITSGTPAWYTVTFDSPAYINGEVRLLLEVAGGNWTNSLAMSFNSTDVKASEVETSAITTSYVDVSHDEGAYKYTYYEGSSEAASITTQAVSAIDKTTATGNGNVTSLGAPPATQHGVCYAAFSNPTLESASYTEEGVPAATGAFTSSLTGLIPNTLYYLRAYVTNSVGTFYGAQVTFTTSSDVPVLSLVVTTNLVTNIAVTTALGHGSIDNNGGSAITQHGVCWGASANPTTADSKTEEGATSVIGDFSSLMTGLTAGTTYHMRAYAVNGSGTGYGVDVTFTTMAAGTPIVTTQTTTSVQATNATGHGTIVDIGGSAVTQHGHCWSTSINPTTANSKTTNGAGSAGAFTSSITGLTAGTTYYIRAYATNSQGTSYGDNDVINQVAGEAKGNYAVLGEFWVYMSKSGTRRALLGGEY